MRFYTKTHKYFCGIDLHARSMYVCILDQAGNILIHRDLPTDPQKFLAVIAPYREDMVVAVECIFTWYWLADLCAREGIVFVLGHALYMKAIHGGKAKNDKIDAHKIAAILRGGTLAQAYVYPPRMRCPRAISCAGATTWCASAPNSWRISRTPTASTICRSSARSSDEDRIAKDFRSASRTLACAAPSNSTRH